MELITGVKLTSNLKKNLKRARNLGLEDAGKAGEIKTGSLKSAKYWLYPNIKDVIELQLRRAREKSNLGFHTNQKHFCKFTVGSDKARGIYYTHLSLENSLEPASSKTSITIAGIYDTEDSPSRRTEIMRGVYDEITKLHLKHRVQIDFPKLTIERNKELRKILIAKGSDFIDKQVSAKNQIELKKVPASHISFKFTGPILFKITKDQVFQPLSAKVFM